MGVEVFIAICVAMGIPTAVTGFGFWMLERRITTRDVKEKEERRKSQEIADKREAVREKNELFLIQTVQASLALGEATVRAVQRIPDAHCNGDMHAALDYAAKVKHEQKDFLNEQAVQSMI